MRKIIFILVMLLALLTGCSDTNIDKAEAYEGEALIIGIIGDIPECRETQVEFEQINFDFLKEKEFDSKYDAIFITKDNLHEASNAEYSSIYKISKIPFYFIDNEKSYVSFVEEDLSYEEEPNTKDGMYITGLLYAQNKVWRYGLYNDTKSEINIKGAYSRVFQDISEIKNDRSEDLIIDIGELTKFTKEEVSEAIDLVKRDFSFPAAILTKICYDEEKSKSLTNLYLKNGRGSVNGVESGNVIILLSEFYVNDSGDNPVLNPDSTYTDFQWILIRDNKTSDWIIDDYGY